MSLEVKDGYNEATPLIMHIDLNSCFATVEQQARPRLRGRPVAVVNRRTEHTMIVTASYEAKRAGVTLGMKLKDAKKLCPELIGVESDPPKYRFVYHKLLAIMQDYSAHVRMKSIDEGVIDFSQAPEAIRSRGLEEIGHEIKQRLRSEIGVAMRCNIGIAPNRFLAKTAAGLNKPDGLDVITFGNLRKVFERLELQDLNGIAERNAVRLNAVGIFTPLQFLDADEAALRRVVFKSIDGTKWHQRLRGWEVDQRDFPMRSAGRQYVLEERAMPMEKVMQRLHNLCESVGEKVRSQGLVARGIAVHARSYQHGYWQARHMASLPFFSNQAVYEQARALFSAAPYPLKEIGVRCYELSEPDESQLHLFGDELAREKATTQAIDEINRRYGSRTIHSADTLPTDMMKQKIPFGSTRYL